MKKVLVTFALVVVSLFGMPALAAAADFNVSVVNFAYSINGQGNFPTLTLTRGKSYTFVNVDGSGFVHPFGIMDFPSSQGGSRYTTGISGDAPLVNGTMTFNVPASAPATLYYQCQNHEFMLGQINVISAPASVAGATVPAITDLGRGLLLVALALFGAARIGRTLKQRRRVA